jgi:hypothetical protein
LILITQLHKETNEGAPKGTGENVSLEAQYISVGRAELKLVAGDRN